MGLRTVGGKATLAGDVVTTASNEYDNMQGGNYVSMSMKPDAAKIWARMTAANVGKQVAIVLDNMVYSAPNVQNAIEGGRTSITGTSRPMRQKTLPTCSRAVRWLPRWISSPTP